MHRVDGMPAQYNETHSSRSETRSRLSFHLPGGIAAHHLANIRPFLGRLALCCIPPGHSSPWPQAFADIQPSRCSGDLRPITRSWLYPRTSQDVACRAHGRVAVCATGALARPSPARFPPQSTHRRLGSGQAAGRVTRLRAKPGDYAAAGWQALRRRTPSR